MEKTFLTPTCFITFVSEKVLLFLVKAFAAFLAFSLIALQRIYLKHQLHTGNIGSLYTNTTLCMDINSDTFSVQSMVSRCKEYIIWRYRAVQCSNMFCIDIDETILMETAVKAGKVLEEKKSLSCTNGLHITSNMFKQRHLQCIF